MANAFDLGFMKINYYAIAILAGIVLLIVIWLEAKSMDIIKNLWEI